MGGFIDQQFAIFTLLTLTSLAPCAFAQNVQQPSPSNLAVADDHGSALDAPLPRLLSPSEEAGLKQQDRFKECEHCPEMVVVPDGMFTMGAPETEPGSMADERPQHRVTVQRFAVGRWPVRLDEWDACVTAQACGHPISGRERDSATGIVWQEAREYVQWLSRKTGREYRLLSESEREYVTRAGTTTAFWWGDGANPDEAAAANLIADIGIVTMAATASTADVANPFGLYGVYSLYDWVEDCWHDNYLGAPSDGSAWLAADCKGHVLRGGAVARSLRAARRSAARLWFGPPNRIDDMSVRVARTLCR